MTPLKERFKTLPPKPGVYLFKDRRGTVIYVGKAKNLAKRVLSYFQKRAWLEPAKHVMVGRVADLDYIIVSSETEAFLLESTLIKQHRPDFNVVFKDDKHYLYLQVDMSEEYPTVRAIRRPTTKTRGRLFGPYTSGEAVRSTLKLLKRLFRYRTCTAHQGRPCLDWHLGRCTGPCHDAITPEAYRQQVVVPLLDFLSGKTSVVVRSLKSAMKSASRGRRFEEAARLRDTIVGIERVTEHQMVVSHPREQFDVVSIAREDGTAAVNVFTVREGKLSSRAVFGLEHVDGSSDREVIGSFITQQYSSPTVRPKLVVAEPLPTDARSLERTLGLTLRRPIRGTKKRLARLGVENARDYLKKNVLAAKIDERKRRAVAELGTWLRLPGAPKRIECYDISNIQGTEAVGSMVVFENGEPKKSDYRKFKIKTVEGSNDVAMMAEVLERRLGHLRAADRGHWPAPNLIVVDGGKPQLGAAMNVLTKLHLEIPAVALAKRQEELFLPGAGTPLVLPADSEALYLVQRLRDEAHRFAQSYFTRRRKAAAARSLLDSVPGIGPKTKKKLIAVFGSGRAVFAADEEHLTRIVGPRLARQIKEEGG